jgi:chemotaxis protein histidine kinase CheA
MTNPLGMLDYFAMEAGEYLDRLRALASQPDPPSGAELVRFARALRGSALMANQQPIARAANALEGLARAVRDGQRPWEPAGRAATARAVETLGGVSKRAGQWAAAATAQGELETLAGTAATPLRAPSGSTAAVAGNAGLDAGARAFAAREGALIASALGQAAQALRTSPPAREAMAALLRRMQPLRGLAALGDLPPLREILDAVDRAVGELGRLQEVPAGTADAFEAAAQSLTRAARDVTERGVPEPDSEEAQRFSRLLLAAFAPPSEAVPIADLLAGEGTISRGTPPASTAPRSDRLELVSHGEFLVQAAEDLERARTMVQRDLRLYAVAASLRSLGDASGDRVADFAGLARDLVAHGVAGSAQQDFAAALRNAGNALQRIPESGPDAALAAALNEVIASLLALGKEGAATPAPAPEPAPAAPEPADDLSRWMASVPAAPVPPPAATPAPAPAPAPPPRAPEFQPAPAPVAADDAGIFAPSGWSSESADLEGSFVTYQRLVRERPATSPSVDGFLASAPGVVATAPRAETPAPAPAAAPPAPAPVPVAAPAADAVVEIRSLCYAGRSALARASEVRSELLKVLAGQGGNLRPLLDELLDLVELAHQPDA